MVAIIPQQSEFDLSSAVETAEASLEASLRLAIDANRKITRKKAKETIEEPPEQKVAREHIEHLQLRLTLLRNIRLNWPLLQAHFERHKLSARLNQQVHLQHLIRFLETGEGVDEDNTAPDVEPDSSRALMTYEVQPTGAGKTGAFAIDIALCGVPSLTLVPFDSLLDQTKADFVKIGGLVPDSIGLVGGGEKEIGKTHVIATYAGHAALMRSNAAYRKWIKEKCQLVIPDEVHYQALGERMQESIQAIDEDEAVRAPVDADDEAVIEQEREVLAALAGATAAKSLKIAFTATPQGSERHVARYFPHCLGRIYHRQMVDAGLVVPYRIIQCDGSVFEGEFDGFLNQEEEAAILNREEIYAKLAGEYADVIATFRRTKDRFPDAMPIRGMAFCTSHKECEKFVDEAKALGLKCRIVTGKEAKGRKGQKVIDEAVNALGEDEIDLIVTVEKLATGFNRPEINAIVWARITSAAKTIQGIGRGARAHTYPGDIRKEHCLVFETNWSLKENAKRKRKPLRLADALARNGEDPEVICRMPDGRPVDYEKLLTIEDISEDIKARFTPETWAAMKKADKKSLYLAGKKYGKLVAKIFGVEGQPEQETLAHLCIGRIIWGDVDALSDEGARVRVSPLIKTGDVTRNDIEEEVKAKFSPETWSALKKRERIDLTIVGVPYRAAIAHLFGIEGLPERDRSTHLAIGRLIWGEHQHLNATARKYAKLKPVTREEVERDIKSRFTAESWAEMKVSEKEELFLAGRKYGLAIANLFGVIGGPARNHELHLQVGKAVWGEKSFVGGSRPRRKRERYIDVKKVKTLKDQVVAEIRERFTPEEWIAMKTAEKEKLELAGKKYGMALASLFGVDKGQPERQSGVHLLIGRAVWGDLDILKGPETIQKAERVSRPKINRETIEGEIRRRFTPEVWADLGTTDRKSLVFCGRNYGKAVATLFGLKGPPQMDRSLHIAIGKAIWGDQVAFRST